MHIGDVVEASMLPASFLFLLQGRQIDPTLPEFPKVASSIVVQAMCARKPEGLGGVLLVEGLAPFYTYTDGKSVEHHPPPSPSLVLFCVAPPANSANV